MLLNQTNRRKVDAILYRLFQAYPTEQDMAEACTEVLSTPLFGLGFSSFLNSRQGVDHFDSDISAQKCGTNGLTVSDALSVPNSRMWSELSSLLDCKRGGAVV
jgi:hypothetical protein